MGRRKKNVTVEQDIKSFAETKEDSLKVFESHIASITQDVIDMFDVKPVGSPSKLGGQGIENFAGKKTYKDALDLAYEWRDDHNKKYPENKITFVNYYPQQFVGRTILMSYNISGVVVGREYD